jgi:hypothetical protein
MKVMLYDADDTVGDDVMMIVMIVLIVMIVMVMMIIEITI